MIQVKSLNSLEVIVFLRQLAPTGLWDIGVNVCKVGINKYVIELIFRLSCVFLVFVVYLVREFTQITCFSVTACDQIERS